MRVAVFDLGTNTFNLLIADLKNDTFSIVHKEKDAVALGMGGINSNQITDDAFLRGVTTIAKFKAKCNELNVTEIKAFGTSALRGASNAKMFVDLIASKFNVTIEVITGKREAELIYKGVQWSFDFSTSGVIMDIGGGSTEFIFADSNAVKDVISLDIGVSRIFQAFTFSDPLRKEDVSVIEDWLSERSEGYFDGKSEEVFIGSSGTFETFWELIYNQSFPVGIKAIEVPYDRFMKVLDEVIQSTFLEREANDFIIPIRKKMAPITAVKTKWVIEQLNVKRILISPCSLKEGVLRMD